MKKREGLKKLLPFVCVLILALYILSILYITIQNDTFFDIKMGEHYITNGIDTNDEFSMHKDLKYVSHHFMVNVITYLVFNVLGYIGLYLLEILLAFILAFLLYKINRLFIKSKLLSYMIVFVELFTLIPSMSIRAQMYSYILFALQIILMEKFLRKGKKGYLIALSILPLVLVNFHAGMLPFYFVIIGTYLLNYIPIITSRLSREESFVKRLKYLFIPIISGIVLMFVNPFGLELVVYFFKTLNNTFINSNISEFLPNSIKTNNGLMSFSYFAMFITAFIFTKKNIKLHHILLMVGTMFMALISIRHFAIFVIASIPCYVYVEDVLIQIKNSIMENVEEKGIVVLNVTFVIIFFMIIAGVSASFLKNKNYQIVPKDMYALDALQYIKQNIPKDKKIFNDYFWGSILMFNDIKPFIDSRCDLYTNEYNEGTNVAFDYINVSNCKKDYNAILRKYDIDYVFISKNTPLAKNLEVRDDYEKIYEDKIVYIFEVVK